jgi:hypothetical protein
MYLLIIRTLLVLLICCLPRALTTVAMFLSPAASGLKRVPSSGDVRDIERSEVSSMQSPPEASLRALNVAIDVGHGIVYRKGQRANND